MKKLIAIILLIISIVTGTQVPLQYRLFLNYMTVSTDINNSFFSSKEKESIKGACEQAPKLWEKENSYVVSGRVVSNDLTLSLGNFTCITTNTGELVGAYDLYDFNYAGRQSNLVSCVQKASTFKRVADCVVLNTNPKEFEINIKF